MQIRLTRKVGRDVSGRTLNITKEQYDEIYKGNCVIIDTGKMEKATNEQREVRNA